jgi:hypothetical protein
MNADPLSHKSDGAFARGRVDEGILPDPLAAIVPRPMGIVAMFGPCPGNTRIGFSLFLASPIRRFDGLNTRRAADKRQINVSHHHGCRRRALGVISLRSPALRNVLRPRLYAL